MYAPPCSPPISCSKLLTHLYSFTVSCSKIYAPHHSALSRILQPDTQYESHTLDTHFYPFTGSHGKPYTHLTHTSTPLLDLTARHTLLHLYWISRQDTHFYPFTGSQGKKYTSTPLLDLMASQTHTLPLYWISWQAIHTLDMHFYPFTGSQHKTHTSTPLLDLMARHSDNPPLFWIMH